MISTSDFRNKLIIEVDGEIYSIVWFQHHKPGKGGAVMRTKLRNIRTAAITERSFKAGEKFPEVDLEQQKKQHMYSDGDTCHFMDVKTYEQITISREQIGESVKFLKENMEVDVLYLKGEIIGVELPIFVELKVTGTVPGVKGDTVSSTMKPATLETNTDVQVPLFINVGDVIKVDTRTGEYMERV